jgi:[acyl-carrier-protein] S-malonyltransferase
MHDRFSRVAFLFPGQGAQFAGMGRELFAGSPAARALFERATEILGLDMARLCFEGPEEELARTDISQPAIFLVSAAALACMKERLGANCPTPQSAAGLSLGEYTALHTAGAFDFDTAIRLVRQRGRFMQQACEATRSGMCSVLGLTRPAMEVACRSVAHCGVVCVANLNSPGQVVISGEVKALEAACEKARELGARRIIPLKVAGAFHSPLMADAARKLEQELAVTNLSTLSFPIVSNVNAGFVASTDEARACLARQIVSPVLWEDSMRFLLKKEFNLFVEIGPGRTLAGLLKNIDEKMSVFSIGSPGDIETALAR